MALEDLIKEAIRSFSAQLNEALEGLSEDLARAAADDRQAAVASAAEALKADLAKAKAHTARAVEEALAKVQANRAQATEGELAKVREEVETAAVARIEAARAEARQGAEAEIAKLRHAAEESAALDHARVALEREQAAQSSVVEAVDGEREFQLARVERLLAVVRKLDQSRALTDVLAALAEGAAAEAPRVAILTLHGNQVRGWRFMGFTPDPGAVNLDVRQAGVIGRALRTGEVALAEPAAPGQTQPPGPGFATLPADRSGMAVPLVVGSAPVAVLYADDASDVEQIKPAPWPEAIEILARHAAVCLENLTAVRTAQALGMSPRAREPQSAVSASGTASAAGAGGDDDEGGARRYARLLVSEIKLYHEAAVRTGRQHRDLLERLRPEIDRARRLYAERVSPAVRGRSEYFEDELVQTLADGDGSLLGRRSDALA